MFGHNQVGTEYANGIQVSDNQIIKPLGERLETQLGKFMGSTVSPDGRFLAATSTDRSVVLQIFDLQSYKLIWSVGTAAGVNQQFTNGTVGQTGPTWSPNGKLLWVPEQTGLSRFPVNKDGTLGTPTTVSIPTVSGHAALTGQIAYSPDKATLYAAVNGQNTVVAIDPNTGAIQHTWNVGIAPRELKFVGKKLYVSDEGGRQAQARRDDDGLLRHRRARRRLPRHVDDRRRQRHRHHGHDGGGQVDRRRPAPDRAVLAGQGRRCSSPTRTATRCR